MTDYVEDLIPWASQPQEPVEVDWGDALNAGLVAAVLPHLGYDAALRRVGTQTGGSVVAGQGGRGFSTGGSGAARIAFSHDARHDVTGEITCIALADATSTSADALIFGKATSNGANNTPFTFGMNSGGNVYLCRANSDTAVPLFSGLRIWRSTPAPYSGRTTPIVTGVSQSGSIDATPAFYADGDALAATMQYGSGTGAPVASGNGIRIGSRQDDELAWPGTIYAIFLWNRILSAAEHRAVAQCLWMRFAPQVIQAPLSGYAGTATASLGAAVRLARSATASVGAAIQQPRSATASIDAAIRQSRTAQTTLDAAVRQVRGAVTGLDAAVRAPASTSASLQAAVQLARSATATIDAAVRVARSQAASVDAFVQAPAQVATALDAYVQAGSSVSLALGAAVLHRALQQAGVDAAVQQSRTATVGLSAALRQAHQAAAALDAAVRLARTAAVGLSAYVQGGSTAVAGIDAAIRAVASASAGLQAAIQTAGAAQLGLDAAVAVRRLLAVSLGAAVRHRRTAAASLSAFIEIGGPVVQGSLAGSTRAPARARPAATSTRGRPAALSTGRRRN